MPKPSVADCRDWLKIPHTLDDAKLGVCLDAAWTEWLDSTGRSEAQITPTEVAAVLERVGNLYGFSGDDSVGPSTWFVDSIRRMHNPNSVG